MSFDSLIMAPCLCVVLLAARDISAPPSFDFLLTCFSELPSIWSAFFVTGQYHGVFVWRFEGQKAPYGRQ